MLTRTRIVALFSLLMLAMPIRAQALETPEVFASDFQISQTISGVTVAINGKIYLSADISFRTPVIRVTAIADFKDLQQKIPQLVTGADLPRNNCRSFSANNPVVSLSNTRLTYQDGAAIFHTNGELDLWDCRENPVPNSKIEWRLKDIKVGGRKTGAKTKVPVVVTWPGDPIKNKLASQPFSIDIPVTIRQANGASIAIDVGDARGELGGQYVAITNEVLKILRIDLNQKLNEAIRKALDPKLLVAKLPKEITGSGIVLKDVRFVGLAAEGGSLGAELRGDVTLTRANARAIGKLLYDEIKKKLVGS